MVYDASSKMTGEISLNECLNSGPSLTTKIFEILMRFRSQNIAIISDIEKAFLQIYLNDSQRDLVRFLWFENMNEIDFENFDNNKLIEYRLCRVLFGVTSSSFLLTATLIHHVSKYLEIDAEFVEKILLCLHVDDLDAGADSVSEGFQFYNKCKERLAEASFNLRKFQSNSAELESLVTERYGENDNPVIEKETKVLGLTWNKKEDNLCFYFDEIRSKFTENPTKREVIHAVASIYDPLGLINPIVVKLKTFFQKVCLEKIDWDDYLNEELQKEWLCILHELSQVHCLKFERNYCFKNISDPFINIQIHGFSDASETAYGCCVYLRFLNLSGIIKTSLVTAKSRVSPVKKLSMPRLELLGALMLSRLIVEVNKHLSHVFVISELFTWTDSSVVYSWIMNDGKLYKVFVQNRLNEIRLNVGTKNWKLVNSKNNPADIVSRGCRPIDLVSNTQWTHGPSFLTLSENEWPQLSVGDNFEEIINKEIKLKTSSACLLSTAINQKNYPNLSDVIDVNRYNSFNKLLK